MFLALNEIKYEKARFILIVAIVALISYLTYFLTALAYGLATSYTQGIDKWNASNIVLQKDANSNAARSLLFEADFESVKVSNDQDKAKLGFSAATVESADKEDVALFGIESKSFLSPNISEGTTPTKNNEVVVSTDLKNIGIKLNDSIKFSSSKRDYKVVGFSERSTFQALPIVYVGMQEWRKLAAESSGMNGMIDKSTFSAVIIKGDANFQNDRITMQTIKDFSFTLPGYSAQVATFGTMIAFLIFISSFVLSIFIYILTTQKKNIFGILKAEGVPNKFISRSVQLQTLILVVSGLLVGLSLTVLTGLILPSAVPFMIQPLFFLGISLLFIAFALLGGLASVRIVTKIDPVETIS